MPTTTLDSGDAAELAQLLHFLNDWLATDHDRLDASLARFVGNRAYNLDQLHADLHRFTFLLGSDDGESLFDPEPQ